MNEFPLISQMSFKPIANPIYRPKRSQVIKNKRRKAHLQRTKRR